MKRIGREPLKNRSEILFEDILMVSGLPDFTFEKQFLGTTKRPDYTVTLKGVDILFEVKEFGATNDSQRGFSFYDPYGPIRKKIEEGRRKFKDLDNYCCCLVLYNRDNPLVDLGWQYVYGAMLGDLGFSVPLKIQGFLASPDDKVQFVCTSSGKMHREQRGLPSAPQNRTISAILVIEYLPVGKTRVVVHENPYARIPLPPELFSGLYDERYGNSKGQIRCLRRGDEIVKLQTLVSGVSAS